MSDNKAGDRITVRLKSDESVMLSELQNDLQLKHKSELVKVLIEVIHCRLQKKLK
ncbi:hypothetical protein [Fulvivirga sp.]|uniref:hypothetical protein n=1 Tax=Fulvivirga sp. TaxID=1931237 RepID=UPI0032EB2CB1